MPLKVPLKVPLARLNQSYSSRHMEQFASVRAVNLWNGFPSAIRESTSVNACKNAYDNYCKNEGVFSQYVHDEVDQDLFACICNKFLFFFLFFSTFFLSNNRIRKENILGNNLIQGESKILWCKISVDAFIFGLSFFSLFFDKNYYCSLYKLKQLRTQSLL